jgi:ferredoxin-NADP reductase
MEARIVERAPVTARVTRFRFAVDWPAPHRAGQSVELRLTAPDGYAAQRFYSIASPPSQRDGLDLLIERAADGEVSRFFHEVAEPGDPIELRGPVGLPFSWAPEDGGPVLLVGGGSGVVPLLAMLRERAASAPGIAMALLLAARTQAEALYLDELKTRARAEPGFALVLTLSREGQARRIDRAAVDDALARLPGPPRRVFVCGSGGFVEAATTLLVDAGLVPATIRTERFG